MVRRRLAAARDNGVVAMAPGLCWDNELGGRSFVSVIVSPAIDHDNNDLLNQQSANNGGKRRR